MTSVQPGNADMATSCSVSDSFIMLAAVIVISDIACIIPEEVKSSDNRIAIV